jgi:hypothetical protein
MHIQSEPAWWQIFALAGTLITLVFLQDDLPVLHIERDALCALLTVLIFGLMMLWAWGNRTHLER